MGQKISNVIRKSYNWRLKGTLRDQTVNFEYN